jgi:hypothetical protein
MLLRAVRCWKHGDRRQCEKGAYSSHDIPPLSDTPLPHVQGGVEGVWAIIRFPASPKDHVVIHY